MKMIPATCECGVEFMREPHDTNPRCSECFFEHDVPDLKRLTDQVSSEEQRGPIRQEENRAATTETPVERNSVMDQSTSDCQTTLHPFRQLCCFDPDSTGNSDVCDQDLLRARLEVKTEASTKVAAVTVSDIFQHGQQVHALRLELVDEDGHEAMLTLAPVQLEQLADWLSEKAQQLYPTEVGGSA